jgi:hypothetical protein
MPNAVTQKGPHHRQQCDEKDTFEDDHDHVYRTYDPRAKRCQTATHWRASAAIGQSDQQRHKRRIFFGNNEIDVIARLQLNLGATGPALPGAAAMVR